MSEPTADPTPAQGPESTDTPDAEAGIDWKAKSRDWERRAKENKTAAEELAAIKESQKSAEQKAAERLADAERKSTEADFRIAVSDIAATHGIPAHIAAGPKERTAESVEEYVKAALTWAGDRAKPKGNYVPNEGRTPKNPAADDMRQFTRQLFHRDSD